MMAHEMTVYKPFVHAHLFHCCQTYKGPVVFCQLFIENSPHLISVEVKLGTIDPKKTQLIFMQLNSQLHTTWELGNIQEHLREIYSYSLWDLEMSCTFRGSRGKYSAFCFLKVNCVQMGLRKDSGSEMAAELYSNDN